jgi:pimeloyl-ACP methyl ester carboxylesterase
LRGERQYAWPFAGKSTVRAGFVRAKQDMVKRAQGRSAEETAPRVRRAYFECRYGQLHVRNAIPAGGGGFDEATTLVCLHQSPMSGRVFDRFLRVAGRDRSVYAVDTPGYGESDAPPSQPSIADYAAAIGDFLDGMRFRRIDLLGYHTGAAIATELALARPELVRRLVLVGVPLLTSEERAAFVRNPWPIAPREDGSHLLEEWRRTMQWRSGQVTLEMAARSFAEKLRGGPQGAWGAAAVMSYPMQDRLALLKTPALVLRPRDDLWEATQRVRHALPAARLVDLPEHGFGLLEVAPEAVMEAVREFLSG